MGNLSQLAIISDLTIYSENNDIVYRSVIGKYNLRVTHSARHQKSGRYPDRTDENTCRQWQSGGNIDRVSCLLNRFSRRLHRCIQHEKQKKLTHNSRKTDNFFWRENTFHTELR